MPVAKGTVPWNAGKHHNGARHAEYTKITQGVIGRYREENAHLRLINADLLEALERLLRLAVHQDCKYSEIGSDIPQEIREARVAIAKATGGGSP